MKFHIKLFSTCLVLFLYKSSFAQLPELQQSFEEGVMTLADREDHYGVWQNQISDISDSAFCELGRLAYRVGDYYHSSLFFKEVRGNLKPQDKLMFSNALQLSGDPDRSKQVFNEYLKSRKDIYHSQLHRSATSTESFQSSDAVKGRAISVVPQEFGRIGLIKDNAAALAQLNCSGDISVDRSLEFHESSSDLGSFTKVAEGAFVFSSRNSDGYFSLKYAELNKKGSGWKVVKWLRTGKGDHNAAFPFYVNGDLYFASDRADGMGGFDIYRGKLRKGKLKRVANLGDPFNTTSNEVYPILKGNTLYFSSNGLPGLGSYDIYSASLRDSIIKPLPPPWNSTDADWMVHPLSESNQYVLRSTYKEMEFIRLSTNSASEPGWVLTGQLRSGNNDLSGIRVLCGSVGSEKGMYTTSGKNGHFQFQLPDTAMYEIVVESSNYSTYRKNIHFNLDADKFFIDLLPKEASTPVTQSDKAPVKSKVDPDLIPDSRSDDKPKNTGVQPKTQPEAPKKTDRDEPKEKVTGADTVLVATKSDKAFNKQDDRTGKTENPVVQPESPQPTPIASGEFLTQGNQYLAIVGAAFNADDARKLLKSLKKEYPDVAIYYFTDRSLYRAGLQLGESKEEALRKFYEIKKDRSQVWLLKP